MSGNGQGVFENAGGAARILFALLTPFLRQRRLRWGARDEELQQAFPGDELVPEPRWEYLHGVTVRTPPARVWPWVAQLGQGRGGFYSYQLLENLMGCQIRNTSAVVPELQAISAGDLVSLHPKIPALRVAVAEPGHALVLHSRAAPNLTWAFVIHEAEGGWSRLLSRYRVDYGPGLARALGYGPWIAEPITAVMDLKMLAGIRGRAEQAAG